VVIILSLLSGFLAYASFAPIGLWWCALVALALLIHLLSSRNFKQRLLVVILFGGAFFGPLLAWSNTYVGDVPWIILTVLQIAFMIPLAFLPMTKTRNLFLFPTIWIAVEFLRGHFPFNGFGWGRIAFSQDDAPYAQLARIGGAPLVSFFTAVIGLVFYLLYRRRVMLALPLFLGGLALTSISIFTAPPSPQKTFSVVAVQGGVPKLGLDFNSRATAVFENHLLTTENYLSTHRNRPDVILWPENSIDVDPFKDPTVGSQLQSLSDRFNIPLIVGAVLQHGSNFQNASILWEPKTGSKTIYIKRHLTPFGEYIPLRAIAEIVSPYAKNVVDFVPGDQIVIHQVGNAKFAPIICFELLDDASGRAMAKQSNAFVVQTNSATFGLSPESDQQLGITRIRSIEHQRFSVSIATSGISAVIDPRGRVTQRTRQNVAAVIATSIGLNDSLSISDRYGSQIEGTLIFLPLALAALRSLRNRRRRIS